MNPSRRSVCIVSRDPLQCSELVLSLQALLDPDDEVEIIMDRRRPRELFETEPVERDEASRGRRKNPDVDLAVRTKGFAIVPAPPMTPGATTEPDADDRARFENVLSFRRRREPRPGRVVGAAGAVMVALILTPPLSISLDRVPRDAPLTEPAKPEPSERARRDRVDSPSGPAPAPAVGEQPRNAPFGAFGASSSPSDSRATSGRVRGAERPSSLRGALEAYEARFEEASGRALARAKGLVDRVRSDVIGNAPMSAAPDPRGDEDPVAARRRPADSP